MFLNVDNEIDVKSLFVSPDDKFVAVYRATNKLNGKFYIGVSHDFYTRRWEHQCDANRGSQLKFHRAIRKYGKENFEWDLLFYVRGYFNALDEERRLIRILKPEYNITSGGGGVFGLRHSEATKQKMSIAKKGRPSPKRGCALPQETKDKISNALKKLPLTEVRLHNILKAANVRRRPVICINDGKEYSSSTEAAKVYGLDVGAPSRVARGERKHIKGFQFEWAKNE